MPQEERPERVSPIGVNGHPVLMFEGFAAETVDGDGLPVFGNALTGQAGAS
nr:hypothetical protein [Kibdelosporangium sp. MJ126-NF4]